MSEEENEPEETKPKRKLRSFVIKKGGAKAAADSGKTDLSDLDDDDSL